MTIGLKAPEPISNTLLDRLMVLERGEHDDLEVRRIVQDANKLVKAGGDLTAQGYGVLGAVASYQLDPAEVERCFKNAIAQSDPDNFVVFQLNRSIALHRVYKQREALKLIADVIHRHKDNLMLIREGIRLASCALQFEQLKEFRDLLELLHCEMPTDVALTDYEELLFMAKQSEMGITSDDIVKRIDAAGETLLRQKVRFGSVNLRVTSDGECNYQFCVKVSPQEAAELTFTIADRLVEQFEDPMEKLLTFSVFPFELDSYKEAA